MFPLVLKCIYLAMPSARVQTHVKVEPKSHEDVWPTKCREAEGSYNDISPEKYALVGESQSKEGGHRHEQGKMTFVIEADTLIYP